MMTTCLIAARADFGGAAGAADGRAAIGAVDAGADGGAGGP
jgi:hypothetical protein